jgi:hypothetical protein
MSKFPNNILMDLISKAENMILLYLRYKNKSNLLRNTIHFCRYAMIMNSHAGQPLLDLAWNKINQRRLQKISGIQSNKQGQ